MATKNLQAPHFSTDRLVFVVPKEHELTQRKHIKRNTLAFHYVGMQEGSTLQVSIRDQAELLGETLVWRIRLSSFEADCQMLEAEAEAGIGAIPESPPSTSVKPCIWQFFRWKNLWFFSIAAF